MELGVFEQLCQTGRSQELMAFRSSPDNLTSMQFLTTSTYVPAQFMAVSILQHALMSRISLIPEALNHLYRIIHSPSESFSTTPIPLLFAKILHLFASLVKRTYMDIPLNQLLQLINALPPLTGIQLLQALIEEFNCHGRLGIYGVSVAFHRAAHYYFETNLLPICFQMTTEMLLSTFSSLSNIGLETPHHLTLALHLFNELLEWEFGDLNFNVVENTEGRAVEVFNLPREWAVLLDTKFISPIFLAHSICRNKANDGVWVASYKATQNIILSLCSFSGKIFSNGDDKRVFVALLFENLSPLLLTSLEAVMKDEKHHEELERLASAVYRVILNFKLPVISSVPQFIPLMQTLHMVTREISVSIQRSSNQTLQSMVTGRQPSILLEDMFDDWHWGLLEQLLDAWAALLTDANMSTFRVEGAESLLAADARHAVLQAASLFNDVMSGVLTSIIVESLAGVDEDEQDDVGELAGHKLEALVAAVCVLGRADVFKSVETTVAVVESTMSEIIAAGMGKEASSISPLVSERLLETLRVCILILVKLISDSDDKSPDLSASSDAAVIPSEVLDICSLRCPSVFPPVLSKSFSVVTRILQIQLQQLTSSSKDHPFYSHVIVTACLRFTQVFVIAYVEPEGGLYAHHTASSLPGLFRVADSDAIAASLFICEALQVLLQVEGLNTEVIEAVSSVFVVFSLKYTLREEMMRSPAYLNLWRSLVSGSFSSSLSTDAFTSLFYALGLLALRVAPDGTDKFQEICGAVASELGVLSGKGEHELLLWIGKMSGLSKCGADRCGVFAQLLLFSLPTLCQLLPKYSHSDPVLQLVVRLLTTIVEHHLGGMRPTTSICLYTAARLVVEAVTSRLAKPISTGTASKNVEEVFRNELLSDVLELLCHLGTKEFMLDDEDVAIDVATIASFDQQIVHTLFDGYLRISPLMTFESLTLFPVAIERYVSFAAFLINSHEREILQLFSSDRRSAALLLLEHLMHCAVHAEARVAQLALRSLEGLAESSWRSRSLTDTALLERLITCEKTLFDWILSSSLATDGRHANVLDRFDALSAALLALVRLAPDMFRSHLECCTQQNPSIGPTVSQFLSSISFDVKSLDRNNRRAFSANLREFTEGLRSEFQLTYV